MAGWAACISAHWEDFPPPLTLKSVRGRGFNILHVCGLPQVLPERLITKVGFLFLHHLLGCREILWSLKCRLGDRRQSSRNGRLGHLSHFLLQLICAFRPVVPKEGPTKCENSTRNCWKEKNCWEEAGHQIIRNHTGGLIMNKNNPSFHIYSSYLLPGYPFSLRSKADLWFQGQPTMLTKPIYPVPSPGTNRGYFFLLKSTMRDVFHLELKISI